MRASIKLTVSLLYCFTKANGILTVKCWYCFYCYCHFLNTK